MARAAPILVVPADGPARAWAADALTAAGLCPLSDAVEVLIARAATGAVVGAVGFERYGADGLLRALVVDRMQRTRGVGTQLVRALERRARHEAVSVLYLLTETAEAFFAARGYERTAREGVPAAVAASVQFRLHCPASAVCMRKRV